MKYYCFISRREIINRANLYTHPDAYSLGTRLFNHKISQFNTLKAYNSAYIHIRTIYKCGFQYFYPMYMYIHTSIHPYIHISIQKIYVVVSGRLTIISSGVSVCKACYHNSITIHKSTSYI